MKIERPRRLVALALLLLVTVAAGAALYLLPERDRAGRTPVAGQRPLKLYWFIPDGLRGDRDLFDLFRWAEAGELPNLKKLMERGTYGYSRPVFPGHTPTNFATLLTGCTPRVHGIADGPMHVEGYPLQMVSKGGFSSVAKKVPPIWYTLEEQGLTSTLLAIPGSTPPELDNGAVLRGRWGGWGIDFPAMIFHSAGDRELRQYQGLGNRVFSFGSELTHFVAPTAPAGWRLPLPKSFSPIRQVDLTGWGAPMFGLLYDSTDDGRGDYDRVLFSADKASNLADLTVGEWSTWLPIRLSWEMQNDYNIYTPKRPGWEREMSAVTVDTEVALNVIRLGGPDDFRIQFFYNNLNSYLVKPSSLYPEIAKALGPMVDFPDNYPPQLIYYPEDRATFLEETRRSLDWHRRAAGFLIDRRDSEVIIHDVYTPNQMLVGRWWLGELDPSSRHYAAIPEAERQARWREVKAMYQGIDAILGEIMAKADDDTVIVFSSDHGIVPLDREVRLNNLFAAKGLLKYTLDRQTGEYRIDWGKTRAIFLQMDNIYLNPAGLAGNYRRASGPEYEELRNQVIEILATLKDDNGVAPLAKVVKWEEAEKELQLPADRVGDLVVANRATYGWVEEVTGDGRVFADSLKGGYKQAILPESTDAMLTPFVISGPGVKKNHRLAQVIRHIDQYPTIMTLLGKKIPDFVEGQPLAEVLGR
ncbi:MAG: sulfatase-like hydrolase/transferase [Desulfobulbaceae bacterium]|nr:sulfatase-like hydrolase/transferase [Desulfobulbaceae bacterium]